ncbi:bifunctional histidinol-phosphatase/imidazoleglycerol-phosphate dehydratase HisB [Robiginitalea sp. SC105]|uniref:bifunctional histidinol-phosphatase/imidazoleglycerol-phosphate dehydratase HisB n=1 Tax=Robiginitalea sp. SC105 TaxID=2762332 RepID=UPI00163B2F16|nr:bifunctional histidinol-phosphatase/imidazoleglycerol-phosphate dehydratase HisB [Robiginitalea sp. SC105]MBC2840600.1 bifunctional histidinol-phosphatase/imidazoleglycerol-phosphate dehydratase HisB [Robiginitalea sp. SC105]
MKKKLLFIDRDGTLIREPADEQIDAFEKLEFLPGVFRYLGAIARETDYELVMVTNQDGLGTASYPEDTFWPVQEFMVDVLKNEGIIFRSIHIDRTFPEEGAATRKPGTGMLRDYLAPEWDLEGSYVIGDRLTDMKLAENLGARGIFLNAHPELGASEISDSAESLSRVIAWEGTHWEGIYEFLKLGAREATLTRKTAETDIEIRLRLNGTGKSDIHTGLKFFDHMLDQLARHGQMDLLIRVEGDLEVDEHHTIEDTAIALGAAVSEALGNKLGIERYGFCLPMDDCLAQVALDFGGRNWLVWDAEFHREKIGDMPTEMFLHFFKSFSDSARANLNIKAEGTNEHHKIEAIFKAFAKAVKMAVKRDPERMILPTTKGML